MSITIVGSTEAGPRCDEDAVFISHSILGTVEEYVEADRIVIIAVQYSQKVYNVMLCIIIIMLIFAVV